MSRSLQRPGLSGQPSSSGHPREYAEAGDAEESDIRALFDLLIREWEMEGLAVHEAHAADRRKALLHIGPFRGNDLRRPVEAQLRLPEVIEPLRGGVAIPLRGRAAARAVEQRGLLGIERAAEHGAR